MARFNAIGFEDIERKLMKREKKTAQIVPEMLKAGAKVLIKAQSDEVKRIANGDRSRGTLAASIKATEVKTYPTGSVIEVYPHGDQPHGTPRKGKRGRVSNAQVGFVLENGRSNMPAEPWMATANEKSSGEVHETMKKLWEDEQNV